MACYFKWSWKISTSCKWSNALRSTRPTDVLVGVHVRSRCTCRKIMAFLFFILLNKVDVVPVKIDNAGCLCMSTSGEIQRIGSKSHKKNHLLRTDSQLLLFLSYINKYWVNLNNNVPAKKNNKKTLSNHYTSPSPVVKTNNTHEKQPHFI